MKQEQQKELLYILILELVAGGKWQPNSSEDTCMLLNSNITTFTKVETKKQKPY